MIGFPQAKINLGLSVLSKRADGFHNLETIYYPLPFCDVLEFIPASTPAFILSGLSLPDDSNDNLVLRAYKKVKKQFPQIGPLEVHLHKAIPSGAGLGGGSADAACMLKLLNDYFNLNISREKLEYFALELGSDCPFFLQSSPCYARGRGEILEPVPLDLSGYSILLVHPERPVSSAWAFSRIRVYSEKADLRGLISEPVDRWTGRLLNDFEKPVFEEFPDLQSIKEQLYAAGALYASLSGSGSSLYGIFKKDGIPPDGLGSGIHQTFLP
jgi:4-diphosphocytidyl-2-C-methyl-D-erythritol kinase